MGVIPILQGLLTPVIAIITTYIAWQQWQGNKQKLKMDGYERRLRVYQEVVKMLKTCANGQIREFSVILDFGAATAEADFLFGPEIRQYLDEISTRAAKLRSANVQYRDFTQPVPENYDHEKIVNEMTTQTAWFVEQLVGFVAKNKFGQYLNISEVKVGEVMNRARQIVLAVYGLAVALAFLWVPWTEDVGYRWLWVAPRAITVEEDIVAEARQRWKAETRANDTAMLGQKWAQELHEAPDTDKDKVREKIRLARDLATFQQLELSNLERMPNQEVLDWLNQKDNFNTTFPERANLDDASRQKLLQEWKTTVHPANEWNARVGAAKVDYKRIGMELAALTALCAVGFVLSPRTPATKL